MRKRRELNRGPRKIKLGTGPGIKVTLHAGNSPEGHVVAFSALQNLQAQITYVKLLEMKLKEKALHILPLLEPYALNDEVATFIRKRM